jgi:hypothetical protein
MTDASDSRRILDLLAQGKITVDEADQLLHAMNAATPSDTSAADATSATNAAPKPSPKWLRMTVDKPASDGRPRRQVNIRVPLTLVRSGMKIGAALPHFASSELVRRLRAKGIDIAELSKLDFSEIEHAVCDLDKTTVDVDDSGTRIRFSSE